MRISLSYSLLTMCPSSQALVWLFANRIFDRWNQGRRSSRGRHTRRWDWCRHLHHPGHYDRPVRSTVWSGRLMASGARHVPAAHIGEYHMKHFCISPTRPVRPSIHQFSHVNSAPTLSLTPKPAPGRPSPPSSLLPKRHANIHPSQPRPSAPRSDHARAKWRAR